MKKKYRWFTRIDCSDIIRNHLKSLVNANTLKPEFTDYLFFLILPLVAGVILPILEVFLNENIVNIVITSLSIFVGLFFNVIVLIITTMSGKTEDKVKQKVLQEIIDNISYVIFISLITILLCILAKQENKLFQQIINGFCYFFLIHFFTTLLLLLKRIYKLFTYYLNNGNNA